MTTEDREAAARRGAVALLDHDDADGMADPNQCETCVNRLTTYVLDRLTAEAEHASRVERLEGEIARLNGVLVGLQWQGSDACAIPCCPSCDREPPDRDPPVVYTADDHNADCDIGRALAATGGDHAAR